MFEYTILHWTTFTTAVVLLNLSPGPDMAFMLGHTVHGGRRAGFAALAGVWAGTLCHALFAALGLSAILATSAIAFTIVKWVGAAYLIWLGISALRSKGSSFASQRMQSGIPALAIIKQGVLVSLLNPKVAIFFLAFLPQFVVAGAGPTWAQLALHGVMIIVISAVVEPPMILLADRMTKRFRNSPRLGLWMDRTLGVIFVGLGVRLALEQR
jgi:threonine/homoserine/homoserine lactone efflux protein